MQPETVLIVDDDIVSLSVLENIVKNSYATLTAQSGTAALELIESHCPDLVLLDINLPDMSGFDVIARKREGVFLPFIFMTASTEDKVRAFMEGGVDYITKPFDPDEVVARIETHLRIKRELSELSSDNLKLSEIVQGQTRELITAERHSAFSLMIQGIVHNLRNPLTSAMGAADIVRKNTEKLREKMPYLVEIEKILKYTYIIKKSTMTLNEMIDAMMTRSRQGNRSQLMVQDLSQIIREEMDFLRASSRIKTKLGLVQISPYAIPVRMVSAEIAQVIENLVHNAADALIDSPEGRIDITMEKEGDLVKIAVENNGPSIPEQIKEKIFEPFFTTKHRWNQEGGKDKPIGTGLGLYTSRDIIQRHGGSITLVSGDWGTRFTVSLPLAGTSKAA